MLKFRALRADEVDCRVAMVKEGGLSLLLYKDARCDMNILDETVGPERWQRHHSRENANCTVSIWFEGMGWVEKEDTGTESNTEAEKGLASDSFKRACFNWGIGRELYSAPFIWITSSKCAIANKNGRAACYDRFKVSEMEVEDGRIVSLVIINDSRNGEEVYRWSRQPHTATQEAQRATKGSRTGKYTSEPKNAPERPIDARQAVTIEATQVNLLRIAMEQIGQGEAPLLSHYGVTRLEELTAEQYVDAMEKIKDCKSRRRKK